MIVQHFIGLKKNSGILVIFAFLIASCSSSVSQYQELVDKEMASEKRYDSILFGMKFGQTKKQFFERCWKLNKKGVIKQGPNNKFVEYRLPLKKDQNLKDAIIMLFYGIFDRNNTMTGMDLQFSYNAWSLWNENLQSSELVPSVKDSLMKWYPGNDFKLLKMPKDTNSVFVKVDGNRRILIKPIDDPRIVKARIDDLRYISEK
ncbi:hypothetical protein [Pseudozobellia sp. WGM2]|uniref:hypothetical protein n=1 Tax=Pseudozobellia sp. WGM2 TaxID=2787625 RepID=UPI001AE0D7D5|nr:hypothetical protein [Pseudozobellia sp. WGM2]